MDRSQRRVSPASAIALLGLGALGGCALVYDYDDYQDATAPSGSGGAAGATSSASGAGGEGECTPDTTVACYSGPPNTENVGLCKPGVAVCNAEGTGHGACKDEIVPAPEVCFNHVDENCDDARCAETLWSYVTDDPEAQYLTQMAVHPKGLFVTGTFEGKLRMDDLTVERKAAQMQTGSGIFMARIKPSDGMPEWLKSTESEQPEVGLGVAADSYGNFYVTGYVTPLNKPGNKEDAILYKRDELGQDDWSISLAGLDTAKGVAVASDAVGNALWVATFRDTVQVPLSAPPPPPSYASGGEDDILILKLSHDGKQQIWGAKYGGPGADLATAAAIDKDNNLYVTGSFRGDMAAPPELQGAGASSDIFVMKLNAEDGSVAWARPFLNTASDMGDAQGLSIAVDAKNNVVVTGEMHGTVDFNGDGANPLTSQGSSDIFLVALNGSNGTTLWSKRYGNEAGERASRLAVDAGGAIFLTGTFTNTLDLAPGIDGGEVESSGALSIFLAKLDAGGQLAWARGFGGAKPPDDLARYVTLAALADGSVAIGGGWDATISFDAPGSEFEPAGVDVFLAKLSP